jgi:hypothetical protein
MANANKSRVCFKFLYSLYVTFRYSSVVWWKMGFSGMAAYFLDDYLPPECEYISRETIFKAINSWAVL